VASLFNHDESTHDNRRWGAPEAPLDEVSEEGEWHSLERFFAGLRAARAERRVPPEVGSRKRRAVMTIVRNEPVFLSIWLRYYSRFFSPGDIYVLDHGSTDGSTSGAGFVRIPVTHETVDTAWMTRTVQAHQHELMERYDVVLVTDVDEIVAPSPSLGSLRDYIDRFDEDFVNCLGYEVIHQANVEPPYDPHHPILGQRGYWYPNDAYGKPALATVPLEWEPGFHARTDGRVQWDPDLRLIHLHRMDYDICRQRHLEWRARKWSDQELARGWGTHHLITDGPDFERWFYTDSNFEDRGIRIALQRIPPAWRGVV